LDHFLYQNPGKTATPKGHIGRSNAGKAAQRPRKKVEGGREIQNIKPALLNNAV